MTPLAHSRFVRIFRTVLLCTPALYLMYLLRFWVWFLYPLPTNLLEFSTALLILVWIVAVWRGVFPPPKMVSKWQYPIVILFLAVATIVTWNTVLGLQAGRSFPLAIWLDEFVLPVGYFLMMISVFRGQQDLKDLILVNSGMMALAAGLMALQFSFGWFSPIQHTDDLRLVWPYLDHLTGSPLSANMPAIFLAPSVCLAWMALLRSRSNLSRLYLGLCVLSMVITLFLSKSYGAWLAIIGACSLCSFIELKGLKRWVAVPLVALLLAGGLYWSQRNSEKLQYALDVEGESTVTTSSERLNIWKVSWGLIQRFPVAGVGTAQFGRAFAQQAPLTLGREVSAKELSHALQPHNVYLMFWLNLGLLGLLSFLAVLAVFALPVRPEWRWVLFCPLLYWLAHGLIDVFYWKPDYAFSFWLVMAMLVLGSRNATLQEPKPSS